MSKKILTLWFPELFASQHAREAIPEIELTLPSLSQLLSKADSFSVPNSSYTQRLCQLLHLKNTVAVAPITANYDLKSTTAKDFWIRIDPVQVLPDRDQLLLTHPKNLEISLEEAQALVKSFNEHFAQDGVQLKLGSASRWYLKMPQSVDIQSTDLHEAIWHPMQDTLPQGNAAAYWKQLITEAQMLFYTHAVNETRRMNGQPEINSVWVWGEGTLPDREALKHLENWQIFSDDSYAKSLGHFAESKVEKAPKNYQVWLDQAEEKRHFIHLQDEILNFEHFEMTLEALEENWMSPVLQGLKSKQLDSVLIELGSGKTFHLTPKHLKKFWRRKKSIARLLS